MHFILSGKLGYADFEILPSQWVFSIHLIVFLISFFTPPMLMDCIVSQVQQNIANASFQHSENHLRNIIILDNDNTFLRKETRERSNTNFPLDPQLVRMWFYYS